MVDLGWFVFLFAALRYLIEWIWQVRSGGITPDNHSMPHAETMLDEVHYGLTDVKSRILKFIALDRFRAILEGSFASIVCLFVVVKTSIGKW